MEIGKLYTERLRMDKFKEYKEYRTISTKTSELDESIVKNASQLKYDKDGVGLEIDVLGKKVTVICDKELPAIFILARISELLESKEKDIKERM